MRTISIRLEDLEKVQIPLGFMGENKRTTILIDCKKVFDEYSDAIPAMTVNPPDGEAYPAIIARNGDIVSWEVTNSDLIYEGNGELQLSFTEGEVVARTYIGRTRVFRSIVPTGEVPEPLDDFLARASEALSAIPFTIYAALEEAKESGEFDGFSPIVNITTITGGHQISIQDATHTVIANVMDGAEGEPGVSPTITPSKSGDTLTITIVDKTGTKYAYLYDGTDGRTPEFDVGSVETLPAGSSATVTVDITDPAYPILYFGIPKGDKGDPGEVTEDELNAIAEKKADVIKEVITESSDIISFQDGGNGFPLKMQFRLDPIQDLHGQANPYPPGGGVNKWDEVWASSLTIGSYGNNFGSVNFVPVIPGETYYFVTGSYSINSKGLRLAYYDANKELTSSAVVYSTSVTIPSGCYFIKFGIQQNVYGTTYLNDISINYPSTDHNYHPYSNLCPITGHDGFTTYSDPKYGGNIHWNQNTKNGNFVSTEHWIASNGTMSVSDGVCSIHRDSGTNIRADLNIAIDDRVRAISGHKYLFLATVQTANGIVAIFPTGTSSDGQTVYTAYTSKTTLGYIWNCSTNNYIYFNIRGWTGSSTTSTIDFTVENAQYFDLTAMFGAGNEPTTVEQFRALFPADYYEYNTGTKTTVSEVNGDTIPKSVVTFPDHPGTVYGGHITCNGDGTGTLAVKWLNIASYNGETLPGEWISDRDVYAPGTTPTTGAQVVYKLATPITYTISMDAITSLLGQNNIWVDNGTMNSVEYSADTKLYVNKKIKASQRLMEMIVTANHEDEMIASKAYSAGDLMIVNTTLYKATTSIANGATLTVGTNVSATTVAAEIAALA